ncbi:MAG: acyl carrier protein [Thermoanaerobaculia bacterium]
MTHDEFEIALREFARRVSGRPNVTRATPLFDGLIDSIRVLDLIAFVQTTLGIRIPDAMIRHENFRNVRAIAGAFWPLAAPERRHAAG